ncbi:MAG: ABC transporter permease [Bacteroidota bacterium]
MKYKSVGRLTKVLLSGQFAFSMLAITASILFIKNAQFQNEMDLGFDTEQIIVVRYGGDENVFEPLRSTLAANPKISMIAGSVDHVGRRYHNALITHEGVDINIVGLDVGPNYLETVELELTLGRDFNGDKASDYEEGVIINESLARELATDNPIGQKLVYADTVNYYVIGVVKDFHFDSFQSAIQPLWLRLKKPEEYNYLIAKTNPAMVSSVMSEIKMTWRNLFNTEVRDIKAPDYARNQAQTINGIVLKVLIFMGVVLAIMSIIGFYSLVSLNLFGRMKEIGVRRVLGSSVISVIGVINKDYIWVLLVGTVSGALISYLTIPMLMSTIWSSHIPGNIGLTVFSILLMLLTCAFTVGFRVFFASTVSPTLLLRDE